MKSRQKITRVQLETDSENEFALLGLVSAEPDYRLSLQINKTLRISLKNNTPVTVKGTGAIESHFSRFTYHSPGHDLTYNLISNKSGNEYLLGKLKKIDYIFQVCCTEDNPDPVPVSNSLRSIDSITAVFVLESKDIKDKNLHYLIP